MVKSIMTSTAQPMKVDPSYAQNLKALHKPGNPLVLANIYDLASLNALLSLNKDHGTSSPGPVLAVATASFAVAETLGVHDDDLTFEQNFAAIAPISQRVRKAGIPLTIDLQDGYGDRIVECVQTAIKLGAAGANIEDSIPGKGFADGIA